MTKSELRHLFKERRAALTADEKKELDRAILSRIAKSKVFQTASALLLYAPLAGEIDLLPLVRLARKRGIPVAFPRCNVEEHTMDFYILKPDERLSPGAYHIPEPPADAPLCHPDAHALCILPALAFDVCGNRLGYGKGYYDRFLATFQGIAVGAVYERTVVKKLPSEPHDRAVVFLFTEQKQIDCATGKAVEVQSPFTAQKQRIRAVWEAQKKRIRGEKNTALAEKNAAGSPLTASSVRPLHAPPAFICAVYLLLLLSRILDTALSTRENDYAMLITLQILIFVFPAIIYGKLRGDAFSSRLRMRLPRPEHIRFLLCMPIVMICGGMLCEILTGGIASLEGSFTLYDSFSARLGNLPETLYAILAYALLPAFCEELIFRAILCAEYERFGAPVAVAVSALFFAMLHFSLPLFPAYLFLGVLLAGAMYVTRSFFSAFFLHLCYNLFCLFGQPYLSAFYVRAGSNEIFLFCLVVLLLLFAAFATGEARKIYHRYARANLDSSITPATPFRALPKTLFGALLSPAVGLGLVLWLTVSILELLELL